MERGWIKDRIYLNSNLDESEEKLGELIYFEYKNFFVDGKTKKRVYQFTKLEEAVKEEVFSCNKIDEFEVKNDWIRIDCEV